MPKYRNTIKKGIPEYRYSAIRAPTSICNKKGPKYLLYRGGVKLLQKFIILSVYTGKAE